MLLSFSVNRGKLRKLPQKQHNLLLWLCLWRYCLKAPFCEGYLLTKFQIIRKVREEMTQLVVTLGYSEKIRQTYTQNKLEGATRQLKSCKVFFAWYHEPVSGLHDIHSPLNSWSCKTSAFLITGLNLQCRKQETVRMWHTMWYPLCSNSPSLWNKEKVRKQKQTDCLNGILHRCGNLDCSEMFHLWGWITCSDVYRLLTATVPQHISSPFPNWASVALLHRSTSLTYWLFWLSMLFFII